MSSELSFLLKKYLNQSVFEKSAPQIIEFYKLVLEESQLQNLTRHLAPDEFFFNHCYDVLELLKTNWADEIVCDLGSGFGSPGLIACLMTLNNKIKWRLVEAEKKKQIL